MDREVEKGNYVIASGDFNQTFSNVDTSMYPIIWDSWVAGTIIHQKLVIISNIFLIDSAERVKLPTPFKWRSEEHTSELQSPS